MVIRDATTDTTGPDRGQLLLVGAIAIAFIILGVVVVFNGVLYTQTIDSGNSLESVEDGSQAELELTRGVRGVVQEANRNRTIAPGSGNETAFEPDLLDENDGLVWDYTAHYTDTKAEARPTIATANESSGNVEEWGRLVYREPESDFTETGASGNESWEVFDSTGPESRTLGAFAMAINVETMDDDNATTVALDDGSSTNEVTFTRPEDGGEPRLEVENGDGDECTLTSRTDGNVSVDLVAGTTDALGTGDDCDRDALRIEDGLDGPYESLEIQNGDQATGWFEIAVEDSPGNSDDEFGNEDEVYLAAWTVSFDYRYDSTDVAYTRTIEVDVYGGEAE